MPVVRIKHKSAKKSMFIQIFRISAIHKIISAYSQKPQQVSFLFFWGDKTTVFAGH